MKHLAHSEIVKLTTLRWFRITLGVAVVLSGLQAMVNVGSAAKGNRAELGSAHSIHHILASAAVTSLVMLAIGVAAMAGEYRHGTSMSTFLVTPDRRQVAAAKTITIAGIGAALGAVAFAAAVGAAVPGLAAHGIHHLSGDVPQMLLGAALTGALYGALGVAVGALTRNTTIAIIAALIWVQVFEQGLFATYMPSFGKWLPTGANLAITYTADNLDELLRPWVAVIVLLAWSAGLLVAAERFIMGRDV